MNPSSRVRATTVIAVIRDGRIAMASDGQVTVGDAVMKQGAQKVRKASKDHALIGFAGGAADALALTERLEAKLETQGGNVRRGAVELARDWRTDRVLRRLEALPGVERAGATSGGPLFGGREPAEFVVEGRADDAFGIEYTCRHQAHRVAEFGEQSGEQKV